MRRTVLDSESLVCMLCNHNLVFHHYLKDVDAMVCKVRNCKCFRNALGLRTYSDKLLEEMR